MYYAKLELIKNLIAPLFTKIDIDNINIFQEKENVASLYIDKGKTKIGISGRKTHKLNITIIIVFKIDIQLKDIDETCEKIVNTLLDNNLYFPAVNFETTKNLTTNKRYALISFEEGDDD